MLPSAIRYKLTLAATFVLLLTFALPIAALAQSNFPVNLSTDNSSTNASVAAASNPPVKLPPAKGHNGTSATATNVTVASTTGWQQTGLTVQQGNQFTISYISGTWTVDINNYPYVGPDGYPPNIDSQIYQGCKYDSSLAYATLLGQIGNGSDFAVSTGGTFTASASGTLSLRINDQDGCLADIDGSVTMSITVNAAQSLIVNQAWTTDSNNNNKTSFAPGDAINYWAQVNNPNSTTVTATFTLVATGAQTILPWSGSVSVSPGTTNFYYSTTVPGTAPQGTYTFTETVAYNGVSSQGQSQFTVVTSQAVWCQCTTYVANYYSLPPNTYPDAKNWPGWLSGLGWKQTSTPAVGEIVVFQPGFGSGIDQKHGHVGIITSVQSVNKNHNWHITVEGSNQGNSGWYTKDNCTNVSNIQFKSYPKSDTFVSYWTP